MKKLIIAACVIALAAVTHAATVNWIASSVYTPGTTTAAQGYVAYLYEVSTTTTVEAITSSILAGSFQDSGALATTTTSATGAIMKAGVGSYDASSGTVSWFMVLFDANSYAEANNYIVTTAVSQTYTSPTGAKPANFGAIGANYQWSEIVPEPTSGLLLLLGMGALALRRKQA